MNSNRTRSQQIRESWGIQPINEWEERKRGEREEHVTRMDTGRLILTGGIANNKEINE